MESVAHHSSAPHAANPRRVSLDFMAFVDENQKGELCLNNYVLKQELGQGAFGRVVLAEDKNSDKRYAIKEFSKSRLRRVHSGRGRRRGWRALRGPSAGGASPDTSNPLYLVRDEVAILKKLSHPNIVRLFEVLDDANGDSLYMVFELCEKGVLMNVNILKKAKPFPEDKARSYFRDIILGVEYLHSNDIVHRDIKPDNLLLSSDDTLKIVDFGVSEIFASGNDKTVKPAGSPAFMAPELCESGHGEISGKATDIWSMGVTLYCMLFGTLPFVKDNVVELYESIKNDEPPMPETTDPRLKDLFKKILAKNPSERITLQQLREHPWVTNDGTEPMITTEENCAAVVDEITDDERQAAFMTMSNIAMVMKAVAAFKRRSHHTTETAGRNTLYAVASATTPVSESRANADVDSLTEGVKSVSITAAGVNP
ncbi:7035_t:CDS:10 [Paraglomus occultum]|uniref:7035_t:CDS:1 n=1 Tax=Paraglomus occultum TaxID=144539 RepID=A0A9N9F9L4_9GLOM|nr:7035_t:CDS:10 [Paraglomus occultum]